MAIVFNCPGCGVRLTLRSERESTLLECPKCGAWIDAPKSASPVKPEVAVSPTQKLPIASVVKKPFTTNSAKPKQRKKASDEPLFTLNGVQDVLDVFEDRLVITPEGFKAFFNKGMKGSKEIPFSSITAIQLREPSFMARNGYIQFTIPGGNESRGGIFAATRDENTFFFYPKDYDIVLEIKDHINSANRKARSTTPILTPTSMTAELKNLAKLRDEGVLTEDEFLAAKKRIIESTS